MRNIFTVIIIGLICFSCTDHNDVDLKKEVFKFVLKDRIRLNSSVQIIPESNDSIGIFNLTLIENSFADIVIDSTRNGIRIFSYNSPPLSHPFFKDSISFITNQLGSLKTTHWDTASLDIAIDIDSPLKEIRDSVTNKTELWIAKNVKEKAFLQISEPIYNAKGDVMISAKITVQKYVIDKSYILTKVDGNWQINGQSTLVGKQSEPKIEEILKPDGTKVIAETRHMIVLGYYDI